MNKKFSFSFLLIFIILPNLLQSQPKDTLPPVPHIIKTECCGLPYGVSYVVDEPRNNPPIRSNIGWIMFYESKSFNFSFSHDNFTPGKDDSVAFTLKVIDDKLDAKAFITFADMAGNDTTIEIEYFAIKLTPIKSSINFGNVPVGSEKTINVDIYNYGTRNFVLDNISLDSLQPNVLKKDDFSIELISTDSVFKTNNYISIQATYKPTKVGFSKSYIVLSDRCNYKESLVSLQGYSSLNNINSKNEENELISFDGSQIIINQNVVIGNELVEIYDTYANKLYTTNSHKSAINISNYSTGVYFVRIKDKIYKIAKY